MKVLLLTQFFSTTRGGGEYVFSLLAHALADHGNQVWIITNKIIGEKYRPHKNINVIFIPPDLEYRGGLPPGFLDNVRFIFGAIKIGKNLIEKNGIELIHSNNFSPAATGLVLSKFTSIPHITTIHDVFSLCGKDYWKRWRNQNNVSSINSFLAPIFEKFFVKLRYQAIHTVSEASRNDLIQFGAKGRIYVIPNSVDEIEVKVKEIDSNQFVYVGRLVFYKNLEVILKAIKIAKEIEKKIKLIIVGGGPQFDHLKELTKKLEIEAQIDFKGHVNDEEKQRLIASSNALVLPSLCEGFGLVILEAYAQNRPALVSKIKPMSDLVAHEFSGYVLDPYDEKLWASYLLKLIKNPELSHSMGKNGNGILISQYDKDKMFQKLMKMYLEVLSNNKEGIIS